MSLFLRIPRTAAITLRAVSALLVIAAAFLLSGCPGLNDPEGIAVTGVTLDKATLSVAVGGTGQLTATVTPSDADDPSVTWSSSAPAFVTVSQTGLVKGASMGAATITVKTTDGGFTDTCEVEVTNIPDDPEDPGVAVAGVTIDMEEATITLINTLQLVSTVWPLDATVQSVSWESSDPDIATVSVDGLVTSVAAGSATITVTTTDGAKTDSCPVTVREADVYIGGSYDLNLGDGCVPGYWKNGTWNELPSLAECRSAEVLAIAVQDGVVYAGGYSCDSSSCWIPGYWIDGTWTPLPSSAAGRDGYVVSIVVSGGIAYAVGTVKHATEDYNLAALWIDGVLTIYDDLGDSNLNVYDVAVSGSDVYVAAQYYDGDWYCAGYWKNGTLISLDPLAADNDAAACAIAVSDGSVVAAGYSYGGLAWNAPRSVIWTDGTIEALDSTVPQESQVNDMLVSESIVYAAGFYDVYADSPDMAWYPCYWINGELTLLERPDIDGMRSANPQSGTWIAVSGSLVYAASAIRNDNDGGSLPYIWRNGVRTELEAQSGAGVYHNIYGVAIE